MPEAKRKIIMLFSREMKRILGENLKKVILYGSYARGDYTENSDIDIMVLTTAYRCGNRENRSPDL